MTKKVHCSRCGESMSRNSDASSLHGEMCDSCYEDWLDETVERQEQDRARENEGGGQEDKLRCPDCGAKPFTYQFCRGNLIGFYCSEAPHTWTVDHDKIEEFNEEHLTDNKGAISKSKAESITDWLIRLWFGVPILAGVYQYTITESISTAVVAAVGWWFVLLIGGGPVAFIILFIVWEDVWKANTTGDERVSQVRDGDIHIPEE